MKTFVAVLYNASRKDLAANAWFAPLNRGGAFMLYTVLTTAVGEREAQGEVTEHPVVHTFNL